MRQGATPSSLSVNGTIYFSLYSFRRGKLWISRSLYATGFFRFELFRRQAPADDRRQMGDAAKLDRRFDAMAVHAETVEDSLRTARLRHHAPLRMKVPSRFIDCTDDYRPVVYPC